MSVRIRYISIRKLSWHREESPRSYLRLFSLIRLLVLLSGGGFLFYSSLSGFEPSLILIFRARIGGLLTNQGERALGTVYDPWFLFLDGILCRRKCRVWQQIRVTVPYYLPCAFANFDIFL